MQIFCRGTIGCLPIQYHHNACITFGGLQASFRKTAAALFRILGRGKFLFPYLIDRADKITALNWKREAIMLILQVMLGIVASATGASGGVAYIGLKGNDHSRWTKICNVYDKYCRHIGSATGVSLLAAVLLVLLSMHSSYSLYLRIRDWSHHYLDYVSLFLQLIVCIVYSSVLFVFEFSIIRRVDELYAWERELLYIYGTYVGSMIHNCH